MNSNPINNLSNPPTGSISSNKFVSGDSAIYIDSLKSLYFVEVISVSFSGGTFLYNCFVPYLGSNIIVPEYELMPPTEWSNLNNPTKNASEMVSLNCVCGAHAIKDARHSSWCDVKN